MKAPTTPMNDIVAIMTKMRTTMRTMGTRSVRIERRRIHIAKKAPTMNTSP
jgi:hypothetical protein